MSHFVNKVPVADHQEADVFFAIFMLLLYFFVQMLYDSYASGHSFV